MYNRFKRTKTNTKHQSNKLTVYTNASLQDAKPIAPKQMPNQPTILSNNTYILTGNDTRHRPHQPDPHSDPQCYQDSQCYQDKTQSIQRNVDRLTDCVDDMRVEIKNLDHRIEKLAERIAQQIAESTHAPVRGKVNVVIDNLQTNASFCMDTDACGITVYGDYAYRCIRVDDLKGQIRVAIDICDTMCIYGTISIYNCENGTVFGGMIYYDAGALHYVLSNRPLIQIGSGFKGIISLMIKIAT